MGSVIESLVEQAKEGDQHSLEELVRNIQDRVYGLALRMLSHPADVEDATQEILVKVITNLGTFRRESAFTTWVYRIAANHLLNTHKRRAERMEITFEVCEEAVDKTAGTTWPNSGCDPEQALLLEEMMISCMQALLLCLDRSLRIAYILGEIFEVTGDQGGGVLDITPEAFRKRLSRGRALLRNFMGRKCGLVDASNPCQCAGQIPYAIRRGWINQENLLFADHPRHDKRKTITPEHLHEIGELQRMAVLFRSHPDYAAPDTFVTSLKKMMGSGRFQILA